MKTHDLSKYLMLLAKVLRNGPNIEVEDFKIPNIQHVPSDFASVRSEDIPQALNMLVGLNNVPKSEWLALIEAHNFDIDIRSRDANRDIYGKLLKYLSDNPDARQRLVAGKGKNAAGVSTDLADALTLLLK